MDEQLVFSFLWFRSFIIPRCRRRKKKKRKNISAGQPTTPDVVVVGPLVPNPPQNTQVDGRWRSTTNGWWLEINKNHFGDLFALCVPPHSTTIDCEISTRISDKFIYNFTYLHARWHSDYGDGTQFPCHLGRIAAIYAWKMESGRARQGGERDTIEWTATAFWARWLRR